MTWVTTEQAEALWADAAHLDPDVLETLLESAHTDVVAFLPDGAEETPAEDVPASWRLAEVYQARSRYTALLAGNDGNVGVGEQTFPVFPLDWQVRQLLRPKRGKPSVA
jgi:hypothetical protein